MEGNKRSSLKVGLAVGYGTGPELAEVFVKMLNFLAKKYSVDVEIIQSGKIYHTYFSMNPESTSPTVLQDETNKDVESYQELCNSLVAAGVKVMFKTAINAQSLYLVRQHQQAVKIDSFTNHQGSLLLVRDQAQGFYSGSNEHSADHNSVSRQCAFSKTMMERIIQWSIERANEFWGPKGAESVVMVYKFHLFDGIMSAWARDWSAKFGIKITFIQPDTANRNLLAFGLAGRQLMIAGNEWADIMHIILLKMFNRGAPETSYTENIYLRPDLGNLVEYQTTHGSADDIGGQGVVNPGATIRAVARILDYHAGISGLEERMDKVLHSLKDRGATTKDQGGQLKTDEVVEQVLSSFADENKLVNGAVDGQSVSSIPYSPSTRGKTAILVVDFQNDFVTAEGIGAHYRGDMARMSEPMTNIPNIISYGREHGLEVMFARFLGDTKYQSASWMARDRQLGKEPKCVSGSWGADLWEGIKPNPGERVFDKKAHFDVFLCDGFERHLEAQGIEHLVFAGICLYRYQAAPLWIKSD
nr:putative tartrate dehydrogenase/decarboxylase [Quercus suber]